jgi:hypothetical protein
MSMLVPLFAAVAMAIFMFGVLICLVLLRQNMQQVLDEGEFTFPLYNHLLSNEKLTIHVTAYGEHYMVTTMLDGQILARRCMTYGEVWKLHFCG